MSTFGHSGNLNDIVPTINSNVRSQIITTGQDYYNPVNNYGTQRVSNVRSSFVGQNVPTTTGSYIQQPVQYSGYANSSYIKQPQQRQIMTIQQQPQQVVTEVVRQPSQVIEYAQQQPQQIVQVQQQPQQIVQMPQQTIEKITEVRQPPEIIERIIEKVVPQIRIEERIIEVERPREVIRQEVTLLPNIKERIIEREVEQIVTKHLPGQDIIVDKPVHVEYEEIEHVEVEQHKVTQVPVFVTDHVAVAKLQGQISILEQLLQRSKIPGAKTNVYDSKMTIGKDTNIKSGKARVIGGNGNIVQSTGFSSSNFANKFHSNN